MHGALANVHGALGKVLIINLGEVVTRIRTHLLFYALSVAYLRELIDHNLSEVESDRDLLTPCTFADAPCMGLTTAATSPTCPYHGICKWKSGRDRKSRPDL